MRKLRKFVRIALFVLLSIFILYLVVADSSKFGLLLLLSGVMGSVVGAVIVIQIMGKHDLNFGRITCKGLKVVNQDPTHTIAEISAEDEGGSVTVYSTKGKGSATMSVRDVSEVQWTNNGDYGGFFRALSMDGKSSVIMSANRHRGGRVFVIGNGARHTEVSTEEVVVCGQYGTVKMYVDSDGPNIITRSRGDTIFNLQRNGLWR